jgi:hypothetical protein
VIRKQNADKKNEIQKELNVAISVLLRLAHFFFFFLARNTQRKTIFRLIPSLINRFYYVQLIVHAYISDKYFLYENKQVITHVGNRLQVKGLFRRLYNAMNILSAALRTIVNCILHRVLAN